jgi:hypothetical protein
MGLEDHEICPRGGYGPVKKETCWYPVSLTTAPRVASTANSTTASTAANMVSNASTTASPAAPGKVPWAVGGYKPFPRMNLIQTVSALRIQLEEEQQRTKVDDRAAGLVFTECTVCWFVRVLAVFSPGGGATGVNKGVSVLRIQLEEEQQRTKVGG